MIITIDTEDPKQIEALSKALDRAYHRQDPEGYKNAPMIPDTDDCGMTRDALLDFEHDRIHHFE